jgi:hypothetical protein
MSHQHAWERAGLGRAPFQFVRLERKPRSAGVSCDYCGRAIQRLYWVGDSEGLRFKVGSECIKAVEPLGPLRRAAEAALKEADQAEQAERIIAAKALLAADPTLLADKLTWYTREDGERRTLREWAEFAFEHGGIRKQLEVCRVVEKHAADSAVDATRSN